MRQNSIGVGMVKLGVVVFYTGSFTKGCTNEKALGAVAPKFKKEFLRQNFYKPRLQL